MNTSREGEQEIHIHTALWFIQEIKTVHSVPSIFKYKWKCKSNEFYIKTNFYAIALCRTIEVINMLYAWLHE